MHYVGKRTSYAILCCVVIVVVVGVVVGLLLNYFGRVEFSGCRIYRGGAAEISVDKY